MKFQKNKEQYRFESVLLPKDIKRRLSDKLQIEIVRFLDECICAHVIIKNLRVSVKLILVWLSEFSTDISRASSLFRPINSEFGGLWKYFKTYRLYTTYMCTYSVVAKIFDFSLNWPVVSFTLNIFININ